MSDLHIYHGIQEKLTHSNKVPLSEFIDHFDLFANGSFPSHWHHELEIQLIIRGRAQYSVNGSSYTVEEGSAIYIAPEAVHTMHSLEPDTVGYDIVLLPQFLVELIHNLNCDFCTRHLTSKQPSAFLITPDRKECHSILDTLRKMYYAESSQAAYDLFLLESILCIWRNLFPLFPKQEIKTEDEGLLLREIRMKTMLSYIWEHYTMPITIEDLANSANISKSECFRCFSELSKTTPMEYINQFRLLQAAQLLSSSGKSISDICYMTGFNNTSYFSKKFKEQYDMTPRAYRVQNRIQR